MIRYFDGRFYIAGGGMHRAVVWRRFGAHFNVCVAVPSSLSKTEEDTPAFSQTK
jgi:hypothetical protein